MQKQTYKQPYARQRSQPKQTNVKHKEYIPVGEGLKIGEIRVGSLLGVVAINEKNVAGPGIPAGQLLATRIGGDGLVRVPKDHLQSTGK